MLENALKMHPGFLLLILIPYVKGELHLIISEYVDDGFAKPINSTIELTAGTNFYLVCMIGGQGLFSEPDLLWGRKTKDLRFRNENDLKGLAENNSDLFRDLQSRNDYYYYYNYESNKVVRRFKPVTTTDRGAHFCMSLKYMLFKIVHIKIKETYQFKSVLSQCGVNKFHCVRSGHCINLHYKCDGRFDCPDRSDENHVMCKGDPCWNKIRCNDGRCIPKSWCCDKHNDNNCNVTIRPTCCPPLLSTYDPMLWYNKKVTTSTEVGKGSGSKYLFITICVVSALLSFVLFLFIISKICGFDTKPRNSTACSNDCEHSECVLRRQFSADVTCLYRRDVNIINSSENNNELADPLILISRHLSDQPPSYSEVINTPITITKCNLDDLINAPPPPYSSTNFTTQTEYHRDGNNESNRRCDNILGDNESS